MRLISIFNRLSIFNRPRFILPIVLLLLLVIYAPTMQTIINGSSHLMMIDVGETQIVLNTWGTLHATSYPTYVMSGNILVIGLKLFGISSALAPGLVSMFWGLLALSLIYLLASHLTESPLLAALLTVVFGLTRFVWVHQVIAEIYSFTLLWLVVLWTIALWKTPIKYRILLLALVGGWSVFHYRTLLFTAPALIFATWPEFKTIWQKPKLVGLSILGGLSGFLPYLYLPLRAEMSAKWVYGTPNNWDNFWEQFFASEANHFFGIPETQAEFMNHWEWINTVLVDELSMAGIILGVVGLGVGLVLPKHRRAASTIILSAVPAYIFQIWLYHDILALLILNITLALGFGWLFLADGLLNLLSNAKRPQWQTYGVVGILGFLTIYMGSWLYQTNYDFVYGVTHDQTGLETIELVRLAPEDATVMLAWGPRYFVLGFAQDVEGDLTHIHRADHNADFNKIVRESRLITPEYTLFNQPSAWWSARLGQSVYIQMAAPELIEISTTQTILTSTELAQIPAPPDDIPVVAQTFTISCTTSEFILTVDWVALAKPDRNFSVLVHLLDETEFVLTQDDNFAPVYGQRPTNAWRAGEVVRDVYTLPRLANATDIRFGLYEEINPGEFQNYNIQIKPAVCPID